MSLELRSGVRAAALPGRDAAEREALRFVADARARDADPEHVVATARENEDDGIDSALVVQSSSWPDPWLVSGWALAATTRLRIVLAHRIGTTAPTVAARALQTLDRLSGGRAGIHLILGSSDDDVRRDGDILGKAERYERAAEFLDVFTRALDGGAAFDAGGPWFPVRDGWSGLPASPVRPEVSFAGSSDAGIALAARYADVYGIALQPQEATRAQAARVRAEAAAHGRTLRIWANARLLLGESDEAAHASAEAITARVGALAPLVGDLAWIGRVAPAGHPAHPTGAELTEHVRASLARATIGSPARVARVLFGLRAAGVDVLQLSMPLETDRDRALRRELVQELRRLEAGRVVRDLNAHGSLEQLRH